jgi:hypothetical protein
MGASIQFRGVKETLKAFDLLDCPVWAVGQGKDPVQFRGEGADDLAKLLEMLAANGSGAIYSLRVYDDLDNARDIRAKTEHSGGFNFQLANYDGQGGGYYEKLKLEERIKELESEKEEEEEEGGIMGKIGNAVLGMLQNDPERLIGILKAGKELLSMPTAPAVIGNVIRDFARPQEPQPQPNFTNDSNAKKTDTVMNISDDEKMQRVAAAFDELEKNDPQFLIHIEKLAKISRENPQMFKMLLMNLDSFN